MVFWRISASATAAKSLKDALKPSKQLIERGPTRRPRIKLYNRKPWLKTRLPRKVEPTAGWWKVPHQKQTRVQEKGKVC